MSSNLNVAERTTYALVVGISNYADPKLNLKAARKDAEDIYELLTDGERGRVDPDNVFFVLDEQATRAAIERKLADLSEAIKETPGSRVIFYFSGHGEQGSILQERGGYLCPYDVKLDNLPETALSTEQLQNAFGKLLTLGVEELVILFDCCYAGSVVDFSLPNLPSKSVAVLASCQADQKSYGRDTTSGHSLFTECLLEALAGINTPATELMTRVTHVIEYLGREVQKRAAEGKKEQKPEITLVLRDNLAIVPNPKHGSPVTDLVTVVTQQVAGGNEVEEVNPWFIGRSDSLKEFEQVLQQAASKISQTQRNVSNYQADQDLPHIFLLHGYGGLGKSSLLGEMYHLTKREAGQGSCAVAPIIRFENAGSFSIAGQPEVDPTDVLAYIAESLKNQPLFAAAMSQALKELMDGRKEQQANMAGRNPDKDARSLLAARVARMLGRAIQEISRNHVVVIFMDTYELVNQVDESIRPLYLQSGPNVLWIIAGRQNLVESHTGSFRGYADTQLGNRLHNLALQEFSPEEVGLYFAQSGQSLDEQQQEAVHSVTRGNPLAVALALNIYQTQGPLRRVLTEVDTPLPERWGVQAAMFGDDEAVYKMTGKLLFYMNEQDRRYIYALALIEHPQHDLMVALLQPENGLEQLLRQLAARYGFVFVRERKLHDSVRYFVRAHMIDEAKGGNHQQLVASLVVKANSYTLGQLATRVAELPRQELKLLLDDEGWANLLLDSIYYTIWHDPQNGVLAALLAFWCFLAFNQSEDSSYSYGLNILQLRRLVLSLGDLYGKQETARLKTFIEYDSLVWSEHHIKEIQSLLPLAGASKKVGSVWYVGKLRGQVRAVLYWRLGLLYDPSYYAALDGKQSLHHAVELYEAAVKESSIVADIHAVLGKAYNELNLFSKSVAAYTKAIQLEPDKYHYYDGRGHANFCWKHYEDALTDYLKRVELDHQHLGSYMVARTYAKLNDAANVLEYLRRQRAISSANWDHYQNLMAKDSAFSDLLAADPQFASEFHALRLARGNGGIEGGLASEVYLRNQ